MIFLSMMPQQQVPASRPPFFLISSSTDRPEKSITMKYTHTITGPGEEQEQRNYSFQQNIAGEVIASRNRFLTDSLLSGTCRRTGPPAARVVSRTAAATANIVVMREGRT